MECRRTEGTFESAEVPEERIYVNEPPKEAFLLRDPLRKVNQFLLDFHSTEMHTNQSTVFPLDYNSLRDLYNLRGTLNSAGRLIYVEHIKLRTWAFAVNPDDFTAMDLGSIAHLNEWYYASYVPEDVSCAVVMKHRCTEGP